jgi:hypothetical protein
VPGGTVIAIAALILSGWLLIHSTLREAIQATVAAAIGLVIYLAYRVISRTRIREDTRAGGK